MMEATHQIPEGSLRLQILPLFLSMLVCLAILSSERFKKNFLQLMLNVPPSFEHAREKRTSIYFGLHMRTKLAEKLEKSFSVNDENFSLYSKLVANKARLLLVINLQNCPQVHGQSNNCCIWSIRKSLNSFTLICSLAFTSGHWRTILAFTSDFIFIYFLTAKQEAAEVKALYTGSFMVCAWLHRITLSWSKSRTEKGNREKLRCKSKLRQILGEGIFRVRRSANLSHKTKGTK